MENIDPFRKFSFVQAKNGEKYLVYNGYTYKLNKKTPKTWYLICSSRCGAAMTMTPNYESIKKFPTDLHSHPPSMNAEKEDTHKIFGKMKEKSRQKRSHENDKKCLRRYLRQKCLNYSTDFFIGEKYPLPNPNRKLPKIPKNPRRFTIPRKWRQTITKKKFLLKHDKNIGVAVFATEKMTKTLSECSAILCDGTFKSCPRPLLSIVYHSWPKNKSKNSPNLGICGWQNNGSLQKNFSNSEIENWGKLGACPNYFRFWKGNNCGCGNGISTQFSQRVLLSFHPSNLSANPKIGAQCSVQRRRKIAFIYKVFNGDPFFAPQ